jgi:serine/threonine-protein kinase HipA
MTRIAVYADWMGLEGPMRIGWLHGRQSASSEIFEFKYEDSALANTVIGATSLDPQIALFTGPQYPGRDRPQFGAFSDASPDRWGRLLMQRRLERAKRAGTAPAKASLHESDYLLGVHDSYRSGALRFKRDDAGPFLDDNKDFGAPPMVRLRELEAAARKLEQDGSTPAEIDDSLRILIAPGGSLGGARPKASVVDPNGGLWIAKFPSTRDEYDIGGWEMVIHTLGAACGLNFAEGDYKQLGNEHHTFLVRRFDRVGPEERLHFASAMTLTNHTDGDDCSTGVSYLELAEVLINQGANTDQDLRELWSRIVFNMLVSNTDDHLRNHGFLLEPGAGWILSPAYDVNPDPRGNGLKLNVSEADNAQDLDLARQVAPVFRIKSAEADKIIEDFVSIVCRWREVAERVGIKTSEHDRMENAFRLAM